MLYDNAQLIELYAKAYESYQEPHYKELVYQTFDFLERELLAQNGAYYSALDADSEGEEGKFYCWTKEEIEKVCGPDAELAKTYWNINQLGYWEDEKYIPLKKVDDVFFAKQQNLDLEHWLQKKQQLIAQLLSARSSRSRPGLDNKILVSWNAMMAKGLLEAFRVFGEGAFVLRARKILNWIKKEQWKDEKLFRVQTNGQSHVPGFLEDYAHSILAAIRFYESSGELEFLEWAIELGAFIEKEFQHPTSKMCFFSQEDEALICRTMELNDNVIPASNSVMAQAFYELAFYAAQPTWKEAATQMLQHVYDGMETYGSGYSNWGLLLLEMLAPRTEWHLLNNVEPLEAARRIPAPRFISYHPNNACSALYQKGAISVCTFGACHAPVQNLDEALNYV
jgi:uncharacterized protein YyaL (SSP411 family)